MCLRLWEMEADPEIHEELAGEHLRNKLAAIVRKIQWSYAIFWSTSTRQPSVLAWCEGYYNGDIKTRKMTQPLEFKADQVGLQRSKQLRELYELLSAGESNQQTRKSASLSPEDLTDAEWYYLVCMTFTFSPGQGLPGKALASKQYIWLNNAQFSDGNVFSRSLLAKSASIQTVVCIPLMGGVLELGITEQILEDPAMIKQIINFSRELPNLVFSEQSISNRQMSEYCEDNICADLDYDISDSVCLDDQNLITDCHIPLESTNICEELHVDSPDGSSNICCLTQQLEDLFGTDRQNTTCQTQSRQFIKDEFGNGLHGSLNSNEHVKMPFVNADMVISSMKNNKVSNHIFDNSLEGNSLISQDLDSDYPHYSKAVANILQNSKQLEPGLYSLNISHNSSFVIWRRRQNVPKLLASTPQKLLKKVLLDRSWLQGENLLKHKQESDIQNKVGIQGEVGGRILSDKEKLNEKFLVLKSLIPSLSRVDKASVLRNVAEYLKHLERRVQELETFPGSNELGNRDRRMNADIAERISENYAHTDMINVKKPLANKRKACDFTEGEVGFNCFLYRDAPINVSVTMKEKEVSIQMHCPWREYLLLDIVESMSDLHLDPLSVQSSTADGILVLTIKSKFRSSTIASPGMIKRSLQRVINKCP